MLTRRRVMFSINFAVLATLVILILTHKSMPSDPCRPDPRGGLQAKEAPALSDLVQAGKLPPLAQRLPQDPLVVTPYERCGEYGGTWRMGVSSPDVPDFRMVGCYAPLVRWKGDCSGFTPGTASSWEYNADGTVLTIHLRKGIKWSDGVEFTTADLLYWAEVKRSRDQRMPAWSIIDGKDMVLDAPDKYTLVMKFAGPNRFIPMQLATGIWLCDEYDIPKHYMQQFDPKYNAKYTDYRLFDKKNQSYANPDRPSLWPWKLVRFEDCGYRAIFERNPYYYAVDTMGRQLPYIDRVVTTYINDNQLRILKILAGEIDAQFRAVPLSDYSLVLEGRKKGGYRVLQWADGGGGYPSFLINWTPVDPMTHKPDPVLRDLFRDDRFRKALSLAIDREKCNEVVWNGLAHPQQGTISPDSWHFKSPEGQKVFKEWTESYAQFDLPRANQYLDEIGLTRRNSEGIRLRKDGRPLRIFIDLDSASDGVSPASDSAQIIADGWKQLGINTIISHLSDAEFSMHQSTGEYEVSNWHQAEMNLFCFPEWVFPTSAGYWHPTVGRWYEKGGKEGEAPTGEMKELLDIYEKMRVEPDIEKCHALVLDAVRLHIKHGPFALGTAANPPILVVIKNNFRNVPEEPRVLGPWSVAGPATSFPESFFYSSTPEATR